MTGTFGTGGLDRSSGKFDRWRERGKQYDFRGKDAAAVGSYDPVYGNIGTKPVHESKSMTRGLRGNIFVSKQQLTIPYVAPNSYQKVELMSDFKKKSGHFGPKEARNTDVRMYA